MRKIVVVRHYDEPIGSFRVYKGMTYVLGIGDVQTYQRYVKYNDIIFDGSDALAKARSSCKDSRNSAIVFVGDYETYLEYGADESWLRCS